MKNSLGLQLRPWTARRASARLPCRRYSRRINSRCFSSARSLTAGGAPAASTSEASSRQIKGTILTTSARNINSATQPQVELASSDAQLCGRKIEDGPGFGGVGAAKIVSKKNFFAPDQHGALASPRKKRFGGVGSTPSRSSPPSSTFQALVLRLRTQLHDATSSCTSSIASQQEEEHVQKIRKTLQILQNSYHEDCSTKCLDLLARARLFLAFEHGRERMEWLKRQLREKCMKTTSSARRVRGCYSGGFSSAAAARHTSKIERRQHFLSLQSQLAVEMAKHDCLRILFSPSSPPTSRVVDKSASREDVDRRGYNIPTPETETGRATTSSRPNYQHCLELALRYHKLPCLQIFLTKGGRRRRKSGVVATFRDKCRNHDVVLSGASASPAGFYDFEGLDKPLMTPSFVRSSCSFSPLGDGRSAGTIMSNDLFAEHHQQQAATSTCLSYSMAAQRWEFQNLGSSTTSAGSTTAFSATTNKLRSDRVNYNRNGRVGENQTNELYGFQCRDPSLVRWCVKNRRHRTSSTTTQVGKENKMTLWNHDEDLLHRPPVVSSVPNTQRHFLPDLKFVKLKPWPKEVISLSAIQASSSSSSCSASGGKLLKTAKSITSDEESGKNNGCTLLQDIFQALQPKYPDLVTEARYKLQYLKDRQKWIPFIPQIKTRKHHGGRPQRSKCGGWRQWGPDFALRDRKVDGPFGKLPS
ncbi:unnamed protein product [Amoebophrya sp. A120]|nr:unnamed protein product [Amoebophrya sp. A120]|eukprot:GSA120T00024123001.1